MQSSEIEFKQNGRSKVGLFFIFTQSASEFFTGFSQHDHSQHVTGVINYSNKSLHWRADRYNNNSCDNEHIL